MLKGDDKMGYSIFEGTMADMNWLEIEKAAEQGAIILFPMGVIEEHGPHLCLGTDIYMSYCNCRQIADKLNASGTLTLLAPPFYWGINNVTGAFPGSFTVKKETMKAMISDLLDNLHRWGFEDIFCFCGHEDPEHILTILDAVRTCRKTNSLRARVVMEDYVAGRFGFNGQEEELLLLSPVFPEPEQSGAIEDHEPDFDVHAGSIETACMNLYFPGLVNREVAKGLTSTSLKADEIDCWTKGGETTREMTPMGYAGNPANFINEAGVEQFMDYLADYSAGCIAESLKR